MIPLKGFLSLLLRYGTWSLGVLSFHWRLCGSSGFPLPGPVGASAVLTALRSDRQFRLWVLWYSDVLWEYWHFFTLGVVSGSHSFREGSPTFFDNLLLPYAKNKPVRKLNARPRNPTESLQTKPTLSPQPFYEKNILNPFLWNGGNQNQRRINTLNPLKVP